MPRDAVSRTANVGTVGTNGLRELSPFTGQTGTIGQCLFFRVARFREIKVEMLSGLLISLNGTDFRHIEWNIIVIITFILF